MEDATTGYCLTLPGKILYLTPLLTAKKFRSRGNKEGALRAFYKIEEEGLGTVSIGEFKGKPGKNFIIVKTWTFFGFSNMNSKSVTFLLIRMNWPKN